mgnify:CR=1 FL=1
MSTKFQLTADNYYSDEANREYLSVSQFKDFVGTYGRMGCEEMALAKIRGEYKTEPSNAMMIGSYVDSYYEGTLNEFRTKNPHIFRKDGKLLSGFQKAEDIIARTERDELFQKYMSGQKQVIMTAELFGVPWKIKMDSYLEDKAIVDLKVMATLTKLNWVPDIGYLDFVRYWGYDKLTSVYNNKQSASAPEVTKSPQYTVGKIYTLQVELKVRTGPGTNYAAKKHSQLTADGQKHDKDNDGCLDAGTVITCKEVNVVGNDVWIKAPSGWMAGYYKGQVFIK